MPRTTLPTLIAMQCFEASVRHLNFTRAGEELNLTQSAVSKQIAQLETILERPLFRRVRRQLQLTPEGALYLSQVRKILSHAEMSTRQLRSYTGRNQVLHVATLPTFGERWLIPRLNGFRFRHPGIDLNIHNRIEPVDFKSDDFDISFFYGQGVRPAAECIRLVDETMVPVCSPALIPAEGIHAPLELTQLVLLQTTARIEAWHDWFQSQSYYTDYSYHGPRFETFSMALRAANVGCGVALVPHFLAADELDTGQLIIPWSFNPHSSDAYFLAYPEHKGEVPEIKALVSWITDRVTTLSKTIARTAQIQN